MVVLIPRIRTINVRLSEAEYMELERLCVAKGSRSISDLVRNSMREQVAIAGENSALASTVTHHEVQVKDLEQKIEKLSAEIASLRSDSDAKNRAKRGRQTTSKPPETVEGSSAIDQQKMLQQETREPSSTKENSRLTRRTNA